MILGIRRGMTAGTLVLAAAIVLISLVAAFADIPKNIIDAAALLSVSLSAYVCAYVSTQTCRHKGLLQGVICSGIYCAAMIVGCVVSNGYVSGFCMLKAVFLHNLRGCRRHKRNKHKKDFKAMSRHIGGQAFID